VKNSVPKDVALISPLEGFHKAALRSKGCWSNGVVAPVKQKRVSRGKSNGAIDEKASGIRTKERKTTARAVVSDPPARLPRSRGGRGL